MVGNIRIFSEDWKVFRKRINDGMTRARCDTVDRSIQIDPVYSGREDLLHEVIHAIEACTNMDLGEGAVQALARGLWTVGRDNPEWVAELFGE